MNTTLVHDRLAREEARWRAVKVAVLGAGMADDADPAGMADPDRGGHHPADLATETAERELDLGLLEEADRMLEEVADARRRLAAGTYGRCQTCGAAIPAARLAAVPATRFCVAHERAVEPTWAGGGVGRRDDPRRASR